MAASTSRIIEHGFLPFGSDDESVLFSESLTSAPTDAGYNALGTPTFDEGGVLFSTATTDGIYFDMSAMDTPISATDLFNGCTVSFEVESGALDAVSATNDVLVSFGVASTVESFALRHLIGDYWDLDAQIESRCNLSSVGKGEYTRVDLVFTAGKIKVYFDYLLSGVADTEATITSAALEELNLGFKHANVTGLTGVAGYKIKNLQLSNRAISLPTHPETLNVLSFGDSMMERGSYPTGGNLKNFAIEQSGQSVNFNDAATLPTIQRELAKASIHVGRSVVTGQYGSVAYNAIKKYAVGGSAVDPLGGATTLEQAIDTALNTDNQKPDVAIIWIGANDITNGWGGDATPAVTLDATWKALYDAQIDRLIAAGASHVFVCNCQYQLDTDFTDVPDVATGTALLESRQNTINTLIGQLEDDITEVTVVDIYTRYGGDNPTSTWYAATNDRHPTSLSSVEVGKEIARIIKTKIK